MIRLLLFLLLFCGQALARFGVTNIPTAFCLCLRRMRGFEGLWLSYRTSYSKTSLIEGSATSLPRP